VPPKVKGKRRRDQIKPISGLDVDSILGREKRQKITKENSIAEFKQMLAVSEKDDDLLNAVKQLATIIRELIKSGLGDIGYERALENIRVMREEMIEFEEPAIYNNFMWDLKKQLLGDKLGEGRKDFIFAVKDHGLGLIDRDKAPTSEVSKAEASEVCMHHPPTSVPKLNYYLVLLHERKYTES
jgi:ATP-dependent DNA helicase 2 subunit 2